MSPVAQQYLVHSLLEIAKWAGNSRIWWAVGRFEAVVDALEAEGQVDPLTAADLRKPLDAERVIAVCAAQLAETERETTAGADPATAYARYGERVARAVEAAHGINDKDAP